MTPTNACACTSCASACTYKPGWFVPGEVAAAAALLGMTEQAFFDQYLSVDWWQGDDDDSVFVLSPAVVGGNPGAMFDFNPRGRCVFFDDAIGCKIHDAKPYECAAYLHDEPFESVDSRHAEVANRWRSAPADVTALFPYPYEPESTGGFLGSLIGLL